MCMSRTQSTAGVGVCMHLGPTLEGRRGKEAGLSGDACTPSPHRLHGVCTKQYFVFLCVILCRVPFKPLRWEVLVASGWCSSQGGNACVNGHAKTLHGACNFPIGQPQFQNVV